MCMNLELVTQKLTAKQRKAIPLLAMGKTGKEVADALHINPATVSQWINHNQEFNVALQAFSLDALKLAQVQLNALVICAIDELRHLMQNAKSEQVRLKAVEIVLNSVSGNSKGNPGSTWRHTQIESIATDAAHYNFFSLVKAVSGETCGREG